MYRIIFGKIFLTLLAFCIPQILSASNDCSDTTDYDFASGNHYTDSGTFGTSTSEDKRYYFQVPEDGVITISADDTNGRISFRHKMSGCPNWDDGSDSNSIRVKAGDDFNLLIDTWDGDTDYTLNVIFAPDSAAPTPDVFNKLCYLEPHYTGCNSQGAGIGCKQKIKIKNRSRYHLTNVKTGIAGIKDTKIKDCWLDHTSSDCNEHNVIVYGFSSDGGIGFAPPKELGPNEELILYTESNVSDKLPGAESLYASYTQDGQRYEGSIQQCVPNYCETHGSGAGFQLVDRGDKPHGETLGDKTFEIFCYKDDDEIWHDLIALPLKNENNNFRFDHAATGSNYYDMTTNPRTGFDAIEINANTMSLVTDYSDTIWDISTAGKNYTVMGTQFSNINLTGTPLQIDWSATGELSGCDESKLRKALGQAVKYNTINGTDNESNDGKSICQISSMQFKIMDDYRFLEYQGDEVLQHSCKEMAAYVPNNLDILDDASVAGHFNILTSEPYYDNSVIPTTNGTRDNGTDIGAKTTDSRSGAKRPITVYCKYQTDLEYVWTFLIALDGRVTQYKTDLLTQHDSCSQMGLFFFVPNSKITFNRVREYLKSQKTGIDGWENYTGTIEEKIQALHPGNIYYLQEFKDTLIWPYGSFGVYKPTDGGEGSGEDGDSSGAGVGDGDNGRPINNISNDINLGSFGWVSILGENDLNKTNDWWISDIGAGLEIT
ncbi:MAG TPA: hypothetical protein ENK71_00715, partial [Epsilonproteobacteria bacterium]|nr:hypothetical protein [Campylobacterota bacterium]